jgi:hypothetical protein
MLLREHKGNLPMAAALLPHVAAPAPPVQPPSAVLRPLVPPSPVVPPFIVYVVRGRPGPDDRPCLPPGHPDTWGRITEGTVLDSAPYPFPIFRS